MNCLLSPTEEFRDITGARLVCPEFWTIQSSRHLSTRAPRHCPPLLVDKVQGVQLLPDSRGSVAGTQESWWSWLVLLIHLHLAETAHSEQRGECSASLRWIAGSRRTLQGHPGHFSRMWATNLILCGALGSLLFSLLWD